MILFAQSTIIEERERRQIVVIGSCVLIMETFVNEVRAERRNSGTKIYSHLKLFAYYTAVFFIFSFPTRSVLILKLFSEQCSLL